VKVVLHLVLDLVHDNVEKFVGDRWHCHRDPCLASETTPVRFSCTSKLAASAQEVYVAGDFNHWLGADKGVIHPTPRERKRYGLGRRVEEGKVIWEKDIWVASGPHDFKFVVGRDFWIDWHEGCGHPRGNEALGGPNLSVDVPLQTGPQGERSVNQPSITTPAWSRDAIIYEIFVRSFYDSNGDGIGDLQGVIRKLDYLRYDLGVTAIWLMPVFASPSYHGYDISDYCTINPDYGSRADFVSLVQEVHRRDMRIIIDYVIGHTSNQHPFFRDAFGNPNSKYADWYIFTNDDHTAYKSFFAVEEMPSLNHGNPAVQEYVLGAARTWMDLDGDGDYTDGIDGLRCDFAIDMHPEMRRRLRSELKALNPNLLLLGEVWTSDRQALAAFYNEGFDSTFDFPSLSYSGW